MSSSDARHQEVIEVRRIQMMDRSSNLIGDIMIGIINKVIQLKELNLEKNKVRGFMKSIVFGASLIVVGSTWFYILISGLFKLRDILFGD